MSYLSISSDYHFLVVSIISTDFFIYRYASNTYTLNQTSSFSVSFERRSKITNDGQHIVTLAKSSSSAYYAYIYYFNNVTDKFSYAGSGVFESSLIYLASLSEDKKYLAVSTASRTKIYSTPFSGITLEQTISDSSRRHAWSADGKYLIFAKQHEAYVYVNCNNNGDSG